MRQLVQREPSAAAKSTFHCASACARATNFFGHSVCKTALQENMCKSLNNKKFYLAQQIVLGDGKKSLKAAPFQIKLIFLLFQKNKYCNQIINVK